MAAFYAYGIHAQRERGRSGENSNGRNGVTCIITHLCSVHHIDYNVTALLGTFDRAYRYCLQAAYPSNANIVSLGRNFNSQGRKKREATSLNKGPYYCHWDCFDRSCKR